MNRDSTTDEPPVSIRAAEDRDREALVRVHVAAARELGGAVYDDEQVDAWTANRDPEGYPLADDDSHFVVATREGRVVGFGELKRDAGEVTAVYVDPAHARTGVGSALLAHLEETARAAGFERLELLSSKNPVPFYERFGWERLETVAHESHGGVVLECTRMEKRVGERAADSDE